MALRDYADIVGGMLLAALGAFIALYARRYEIGTMSEIGPGFFPVALGVLLILLGAIIAVPAFAREGAPIRFDLRPFLFIVASLLIFSFALRPLGLIVATAATVFVASLATPQASWRQRVGLVLFMPVLTYVLFILALRMIVPVWPPL